MEENPLSLFDGGIEERKAEVYDFDNKNRKSYGGYLFQYTLSGVVIFEKDSRRYRAEKGKAFLVSYQEVAVSGGTVVMKDRGGYRNKRSAECSKKVVRRTGYEWEPDRRSRAGEQIFENLWG